MTFLSGPTELAFHSLLHLRTESSTVHKMFFFCFILNNRQCTRLQITWFQNTSRICNSVHKNMCPSANLQLSYVCVVSSQLLLLLLLLYGDISGVTKHSEYWSFDQVFAGRLYQRLLKWVYKAGNMVKWHGQRVRNFQPHYQVSELRNFECDRPLCGPGVLCEVVMELGEASRKHIRGGHCSIQY